MTPRSVRALTVVALFLATGLAGCRSAKEVYAAALLTGNTITYEQYLSIEQDRDPPPTVDEVVRALGKPAQVYDRNGKRLKVVYHAFSMTDQLKRAEFHFDGEERLMKKELW